MKIITKILRRIKCKTITSEQFLNNLRNKGVRIGQGTIVFTPNDIQIDISRPELLEIGDNVLLHRGTIIMTHDYASRCFVNKYNDFIKK